MTENEGRIREKIEENAVEAGNAGEAGIETDGGPGVGIDGSIAFNLFWIQTLFSPSKNIFFGLKLSSCIFYSSAQWIAKKKESIKR